MAINPITGLPETRITQSNPALGMPNLNPLVPQQIPQQMPQQQGAYNFDASQFLPGIQQTASSIYDPQKAQLQALQALGSSKTEQARITTKSDFAKELERNVEQINARGAFFGGGAIAQGQNITQRETTALGDLTMQDQANQAGFLSQQAQLGASQADYIQNKLSGAENSAYSRFTDQRNFDQSSDQFAKEFGLKVEQLTNDQLQWTQQFAQNQKQFDLQYKLDIDKFGQEVAQDNFNNNMATSQFEWSKKIDTDKLNTQIDQFNKEFEFNVQKFGADEAQRIVDNQMDTAKFDYAMKESERNYVLAIKQLDLDKKKSKAAIAEAKAQLKEDKRQFDLKLKEMYDSAKKKKLNDTNSPPVKTRDLDN